MWIEGKPNKPGKFWVRGRGYNYIIHVMNDEKGNLKYWVHGAAYGQPMEKLQDNHYQEIKEPT